MRVLLFAILACIWFGGGSPAKAWGNSGHRTVCEIAFRNLTPTARAEVARLLSAHPVIPLAEPRHRELGWACTYPDRPVPGGPVRRDPEHFVNYPRNLPAVILESGCGSAHLCINPAILADFALLRSSNLADRHRAVALIYLGHWIGDIHQPLHNSFADDLGGNRLSVSGLCQGSLHSSWDTCILERQIFGNVQQPTNEAVRQLAGVWSAAATDAERAEWLAAAPWQWSRESYEIALRPELQYCVMIEGSCRYATDRETFNGTDPRVVPIDQSYVAMAMPIVQRRITQAGLRLAHLINLALDPAYRSGL